jgi:6-phosphogluconolactonase (cycloisomerase 2 family)
VISPDGRHLVVAVHGGGAYNVLPIGSSGELGHVAGILKEVGSSQHPDHQMSAHPHTMVIDASGRYLLATDQGCDRLSVFTLQDGRIVRRHRTLLRQGDGPGHLVSHPSGQFFYVSNASNGSVAGYHFCEDTGEIAREICRSETSTSTEKMWHQNVLVIPASGKFLYSSVNTVPSGDNGGIAVWRINPVTGELSHVQMWREKRFSSRVLVSTPDGRGLFAVDNGQHRVVQVGMDSDSGQIHSVSTLAEIAKPSALVMKYL